jgi:hypothetical protein
MIPVFTLVLFFSASCTSASGSQEKASGQESSSNQTKADAHPEYCSLNESSDSFDCEMSFALNLCKGGPDNKAKSEFILRMTKISLEMLYLDAEPGAVAPYRYRNPAAVISEIKVTGCREGKNSCLCRMSYSDKNLKEIFYDSAGCRAGSPHSEHPLYFKGRGCR